MVELLKLKSKHLYAYRPDGCDTSYVTGIFWDAEHKRPAISLLYENGKTDWIPLSEIIEGNYLENTTPIYTIENRR